MAVINAPAELVHIANFQEGGTLFRVESEKKLSSNLCSICGFYIGNPKNNINGGVSCTGAGASDGPKMTVQEGFPLSWWSIEQAPCLIQSRS